MANNEYIFSHDNKYRYTLFNCWEEKRGCIAFVGLNPTIANRDHNNATVTRCINYAKSWGYGAMYMLNLFALIAPNHKILKNNPDPIGSDNDGYLKYILSAMPAVCCWGNHGTYMNRDKQILNLIKFPLCLKKNKGGQPSHPLSLKANLEPIQYE